MVYFGSYGLLLAAIIAAAYWLVSRIAGRTNVSLIGLGYVLLAVAAGLITFGWLNNLGRGSHLGFLSNLIPLAIGFGVCAVGAIALLVGYIKRVPIAPLTELNKSANGASKS